MRDRDGLGDRGQRKPFRDPALAVATDEVRTPTQPAGRKWTVVHRKPAVVIAALTREGNSS